ncbi:hypothetical protein [Bremerella alba]|uniref:Lipoprotein n=1 Tax=Bremerella alba TaxID=980252 RepID=A0A7V9A9Q6_9BACT|nr:hypothetical protein [Bremerella alba]MBA2117800.1 hypothetical protein [Bremerella alba]
MTLRVHYHWFVLVVLVFSGCGVSGESPVRVVPPAPDAKETLQQIGSTGNLKAMKSQLYQEIDGMREAMPEKAAELMADFQKLVAEKDTARVKTMAQEMADKL